MFIGTYWAARAESKQEVAARLAAFLEALTAHGEPLSKWFLKGWSRRTAFVPLPPDPGAIAAQLSVNRTDIGRVVLPQLGFSLGLWNGRDASLSATLGATSLRTSNSVVLDLGSGDREASSASSKAVLQAMIAAFDPDHGVVTSTQLLSEAGVAHPWQAGWLTHERGGRVVQHPLPRVL